VAYYQPISTLPDNN